MLIWYVPVSCSKDIKSLHIRQPWKIKKILCFISQVCEVDATRYYEILFSVVSQWFQIREAFTVEKYRIIIFFRYISNCDVYVFSIKTVFPYNLALCKFRFSPVCFDKFLETVFNIIFYGFYVAENGIIVTLLTPSI